MVIRRKAIYIFLIALLFILNNNGAPYEAHTSVDHTASYMFGRAPSAPVCYGAAAISKPAVNRDHIRVRYMGGECSFVSSPFPVSTRHEDFAENAATAKNCFFVPLGGEFLFKLRGPPLC